jgi:hypothetical protein
VAASFEPGAIASAVTPATGVGLNVRNQVECDARRWRSAIIGLLLSKRLAELILLSVRRHAYDPVYFGPRWRRERFYRCICMI